MVHGQQQKGLVAVYNVRYLCRMGVLGLVTGAGGGGGGAGGKGGRGHHYCLHAAVEEVERNSF